MGCEETQLESILGYTALAFELIHRFPQLYKLHHTKRGDDISIVMLFTQLVSLCLYTVYAILRKDMIILFGSIVPITQTIVMYFMIRKYKKIPPPEYLIMDKN